MNSLQDLLDIEAIRCLKARYCLLLDAHEWDLYRELFAEDAQISTDSGSYSGAEAFVDHLRMRYSDRAASAQAASVHTVIMPIIRLTGPDSAQGMWTLSTRGGVGHYEEEYRRLDGAWRIAKMSQTWILPPSADSYGPSGPVATPVASDWRSLVTNWGVSASSHAGNESPPDTTD
jgi:hypothetical protein